MYGLIVAVAQCEDLKLKYYEEMDKRKKLHNIVQETKGVYHSFLDPVCLNFWTLLDQWLLDIAKANSPKVSGSSNKQGFVQLFTHRTFTRDNGFHVPILSIFLYYFREYQSFLSVPTLKQR